MSDHAAVSPARPLSVQLDLQLDSEPITGRLRTEHGADEELMGWLGFIEALRSLSDAQTHERS